MLYSYNAKRLKACFRNGSKLQLKTYGLLAISSEFGFAILPDVLFANILVQSDGMGEQ